MIALRWGRATCYFENNTDQHLCLNIYISFFKACNLEVKMYFFRIPHTAALKNCDSVFSSVAASKKVPINFWPKNFVYQVFVLCLCQCESPQGVQYIPTTHIHVKYAADKGRPDRSLPGILSLFCHSHYLNISIFYTVTAKKYTLVIPVRRIHLTTELT